MAGDACRTKNVDADGLGDLTGLRTTVNGSEVFGTAYTHDGLGRIRTPDETVVGADGTPRSRSVGYTYDNAGRLVSVSDASDGDGNWVERVGYTYDGNGNRTSVTRPAGSPLGSVALGSIDCGAGCTGACPDDRILRYGSTSFAYDANGTLQSKTVGSDVTSYEYDLLGRLEGVQLPSSRAVSRVDYVHDPMGRRTFRVRFRGGDALVLWNLPGDGGPGRFEKVAAWLGRRTGLDLTSVDVIDLRE